MNFENYIKKCKPELIGEIIIKSNLLESSINRIITNYLKIGNIKSQFVNDVILNPLNLSFSKKYQIFKMILIEELNYKNKDLRILDNDFHKIFNIRNIIAHNEPSPDLKYKQIKDKNGFHNFFEFDFENIRMLHLEKNLKHDKEHFSYPKIEDLYEEFNIKWTEISKLIEKINTQLKT